MAETISPIEEWTPPEWALFVDGASNIKGKDPKIVLEEPNDILIEQALKLEFTDDNNQTEYEALIIGIILILEMGASRWKEKNYSELVINQVIGSTKLRSLN